MKQAKAIKGQFNSMLKVVRPKVYITDSSSFKRLVQELTGNGGGIISSENSPKQEEHDSFPVIQIEDHERHDDGCCLEGQVCHEMNMLSPLAAFTALQSSWIVPQVDKLASIEDPCPFLDDFIFPTHEEEFFSSQCDLSELYSIINA